MIVVDTNVLSETMRPAPDPRVVSWLDAQASETLAITTITVAELMLGAAVLPEGKRRAELSVKVQSAIAFFGTRILSFDFKAATAYARLIAAARHAGTQIGFGDGQIAAIADANGCSVATRDAVPFRAAGLAVIDPWE